MPRLASLPPAPTPLRLPLPPAPRGVPSDPQKYAVAVKPSRIDGQGAFAAEPVPARRKIGEIRGEAVSVREARRRAKGRERIMIVELSETRAIDATHSTDPCASPTTPCRPNAAMRIRQGRVEFYAMRDIAPGEEITVNYGETHHEGRLACRCWRAGLRGQALRPALSAPRRQQRCDPDRAFLAEAHRAEDAAGELAAQHEGHACRAACRRRARAPGAPRSAP